MIKSQKKFIDGLSYKELLYRWRFASLGDTLFHDETGAYYSKVMAQKRDALSHEDQVSASKSVGWSR